jgi:hypothetical protein
MTPIFCNREFQHPADGWYQIEPKGEHPNQEAEAVQVIDDQACDSIVNRFNKQAANPEFPGMLVDHEHFKLQMDKETIAYGWLMRLQNRADGIYGQVKWTATGRAAVDGGDYRFFSTEYDPADCIIVNRGQPVRLRPLALDGISLTNAPNNHGGKPITNRAGAETRIGGEPEAAGMSFSSIVNRIRLERNCTFDAAWNLARQQQSGALAGKAATPSGSTVAPAMNRTAAPEVDFPRLASQVILSRAQAEQLANGGRFDEHWKRIRNRYPWLLEIANRETGWDALADLEPAAHLEYIRAKANPNIAASKMHDAVMDLRSKFPNLRPDEQTQKLEELCPHLLSQYRLEQTALNPRFEKAMKGVTIEFPDLGFEGRWEKLKQLYPKLFWEFVLTVGTKSEQAP